MLLGFYLHNLSPFILEIRPGFGLRWYGLAYVMAFACGYWLYSWLSKKGYSELPPEQVGDFITWAALFGVLLGGRLGYVLFYGLPLYLQNPLDIFKVWDGGMASHGGILGLVFFTLYYARKHKLSWPGIGDNLCVVAPIGLFFGRCANFINGELYGHVSRVAWAVQFPKELYEDGDLATQAAGQLSSVIPADGTGMNGRFDSASSIIEFSRHNGQAREVLRQILQPRHPSQIYEALLEGVVLFGALWFLRTKVRTPRGVITGAFFILYAILRIIGEVFRVPDAAMVGPFTRGQFLSLFMFLIGAAFIAYGLKTRHYERAQQRA
ncbi:MAG: prolipoprotein diacylglyceryl transferase [Verrucomicrobiota bacterium]